MRPLHRRETQNPTSSSHSAYTQDSNRPMEMLHLDLLQGPCAALGTGFRYILVIVDDYTRMAWCIGLKEKDIRKAWKQWYTMVKLQYKSVIQFVSGERVRV